MAQEKITPLTSADTYRITDAAGADYDLICQHIKSGKFEFFEVAGCAFVTTKEPDKNELVVVCAQGENLVQACEIMLPIVMKHGFSSIRYHTQHSNLNRLLQRFKFQPVETIYRLEL